MNTRFTDVVTEMDKTYSLRVKKLRVWKRCEIAICFCDQLSYRHVHCPCMSCCGKAVSTSTERRHWENAKVLWMTNQDSNVHIGQPAGNVSEEAVEDEYIQANMEVQIESEDEMTNTNSSTYASHESEIDDCMGESASDNELGRNANDDSDSDNSSDEGSSEEAVMVKAIIEAFTINDSMNGSHENFMSILTFGKRLYKVGNKDHDVDQWPKSYYKALKTLESVGYSTIQEKKICLSGEHPTQFFNYNSSQDNCTVCHNTLSIPVFYKSLKEKIKSWCGDENMCKKMMAHWKEKDHWIRENPEEPFYPIKEVWDGTRFAEVSWFWNPEVEWILPAMCENCNYVIPANNLTSISGSTVDIVCERCGTNQIVAVKSAFGDPRNIALLLHWDGFQPFRESEKHSSGAIEVSILNMSKEERNRIEEVYTLTFIPVYLLPNQRPNVLDPFLEPLLLEVEDLFINGIEVEYSLGVDDLAPGEANIRCIILGCTGDYPAQCEIGKFINGGVMACRREKLEGARVNNTSTYYYVENRKYNRDPWPVRDWKADKDLLDEIENEDRPTTRMRLSKQSGYTGKSQLIRLSSLIGFDVCKDLLLDMMHNIPMNVVKKLLDWLVDKGSLMEEEVDKRLEMIEWNSDFKSGRMPRLFSKRQRWKAEEFQKFIFPLAEVIIGDLLCPEEYHLLQLLARITEMVYNFRNGWSSEMCCLFERLVKRFVILSEEWLGQSFCVITTHNLLHIMEDVTRFGLPDNYWCWPFERCVKKYIRRSNNMKGLEKSFLLAESRREVLKKYKQIGRNDDGIGTNIDEVSASSVHNAKYLQRWLKDCPSILVGGLSSNFHSISKEDFLSVSALVHPVNVDNYFHCFKCVLLTKHGYDGKFCHDGEFVLVKINEDLCLAKLDFFLNAALSKDFHVAICDLFDLSGNDSYSGQKIFSGNSDLRIAMRVTDILRKVMVWKTDSDMLLAIDYERPELPISSKDIFVPLYVKSGDMVKVDCQDGVAFAFVHDVNRNAQLVQVFYFERSSRSNSTLVKSRYPRDTVSLDCVIELCSGELSQNKTSFQLQDVV